MNRYSYLKGYKKPTPRCPNCDGLHTYMCLFPPGHKEREKLRGTGLMGSVGWKAEVISQQVPAVRVGRG